MPGDEQANLAIHDFLDSWLLKDDLKTALMFVSPTSYACFDPPLAGAKGEKTFLSGLVKVRKALGRRALLADYLEPLIPDDATLRLVNHPDEKAFSILSLPESSAQSSMCNSRQKRYTPSEAIASEEDYGRYYAAAFTFRVPGDESAALYTLWGHEKDRWKMVAWQLLAP